MLKLAYFGAALVVASVPATAQIVFQDGSATSTAKAPTTVKTAKPSKDSDKLVCRSQDTLGSRLDAHQVCMTKEQWAANEQEAKQKVHDMQVIGYVSH
jgi:hypothetical protein